MSTDVFRDCNSSQTIGSETSPELFWRDNPFHWGIPTLHIVCDSVLSCGECVRNSKTVGQHLTTSWTRGCPVGHEVVQCLGFTFIIHRWLCAKDTELRCIRPLAMELQRFCLISLSQCAYTEKYCYTLQLLSSDDCVWNSKTVSQHLMSSRTRGCPVGQEVAQRLCSSSHTYTSTPKRQGPVSI